MSEEPNAGPIDHLVEVLCDLGNHTLLAEGHLSLKLGDLVVWSFLGIPEDWTPWIEFEHEAEQGFLGPFVSLSQSTAGVWGRCRLDLPEEARSFSYRATIQKGVGLGFGSPFAVVSSGKSTLDVLPADVGSRQVFTVAPKAGSSDVLEVNPRGVVIEAGDTVEWRFEGLPEDLPAWRPRVNFRRYDGAGSPTNLLLGPFTSLTYAPGKMQGMGNNDIAGTYYFEVAVVKLESGEVLWIGSGDPAIDNRGGVGDPNSGGGGGG
jgi:hypothetical protein